MRRALVAVYLHLIWATWDRLPLLDATIERDVRRAIQAKARELGAEPLAIGGVEDHVHLLVQLPSTITIADLVGGVKGASAHLVTHELRPGEFFQWQGAYAAFSVGVRQLDRAKEYIANQPEHHAAGGKDVQWERAIFTKLHAAPAASQEFWWVGWHAHRHSHGRTYSRKLACCQGNTAPSERPCSWQPTH